MTLGYRTTDGSIVTLKPITAEATQLGDAPALKLSGRAYAAMSTGRVLRAAQAHFDYPAPDGDGAVRSGAKTVAADELGPLMARKRFAVFEDGESGLLRLAYRELVLRFRADSTRAQQAQLLKKLGLSKRSGNAFHTQQFVVVDAARRYSVEALIELALQLGEQALVEFATPNFISQYTRCASSAPPSPAKAQWHLAMVHARQAWALSQGRKSITVAVLDDGVDVDHPELKARLKRKPDPQEPRDLLGRDFYVPDSAADHFDPRPKRFRMPFDQMNGNDIHGSCCAGVAVGSGPRGFGMAPRCSLLPVKIFHADDLASDARVADAMRYAAQFADVISCSWGGPRSPDLQSAIADASAQGRAGRGAVIVCAAGNEAAPRVSYPAADPHCIAVGASTDARLQADYSNSGPQLAVVAPSSGGAKGIVCTDVAVPGRGFNIGSVAAGGADGLFTNDFGGTSSATPLVAGLAALMLSLKPQLSPAQVADLLKHSAVKIGPPGSYDANGHSNAYGHGMVDALKTLKAVKALQP